jgi:hypothetical protein
LEQVEAEIEGRRERFIPTREQRMASLTELFRALEAFGSFDFHDAATNISSASMRFEISAAMARALAMAMQ